MGGVDLSHGLIAAIGQFAGTFTNVLALGLVLGLACLTRRPLMLRLAALPIGIAIALPHALATPVPIEAAALLVASALGALLQVEVLLGLVLPAVQLLRRGWQALLGRRAGGLPPRA